MDDDWYDKGRKYLENEIVADTGVELNNVREIYAWLVNTGFIDYDIEKEIIYDRYFD